MKTTSILVVDDEPTVLDVFTLILRTAGYEVYQASTGRQGLQLVREKKPDLVLLDVMLPDLSGKEVCKQIKSDPTLPDVFVVLCSGEAISTAHKVDGLDTGADDYLVKPLGADEMLARIRALVRLRHTTAALRASETHFRRLVEILPDAVCLIHPDGRLLSVNPQGARMLGYASPAEVFQQTIYDLTPKADHERIRSGIASALETGVMRNADCTMLRKNGDPFPVEWSATVSFGGNGHPAGLVSVIRDVTERRRAEQKIHQLLEVLDQARDAIIIRDLDGIIQYFNEGAERLLGWEATEVLGRRITDLFFRDETAFAAAQQKLLQTGEWDGEVHALTKQGQLVILHKRWTLVQRPDGQSPYVVSINTNITERKVAEELLREREELSRRIINTAEEGFWMLDLDGKLVDVNNAYCRMSGYTREELLSMHISDVEITETSPELVAQHIQRIVQSGSDRFETRHRRKDGRIIEVEVIATFLQLRERQVFAFLRDITERKHAERAVKASEERFRQLAENIREVFWMTNPTGGEMIYISPSYEEIWGRTCQSLYASPETWSESIHPADRQRVVEAASAKQIAGKYDEVYRIVRPDGPIRWIQDRAFPIRDETGRVYRIVGIADDITERKQAEANYQSIFENAMEGIFQTTPAGRYLSANPAVAQMLGYASAQEFMATVVDLGEQLCVDPASRLELKRRLETDGYVRGFENQLYCKDGSKKWFSINARIVRDGNGAVLYYEGTNQDITQRKAAEEALRESEARKSAIMQAALDAIITIDQEGKIRDLNPAAEKTFGCNRAKMLGKEMAATIFPSSLRPWFRRGLSDLFSGRNGAPLGNRIEVTAIRADGTEFPVEFIITRIELEGPPVFTAFIRDISKRKRVQEQIRLFADAIQSTHEIISITDPENRFTFVNQAFLRTYGYHRGEVVGHKPGFLYSPNNSPGLCEQVFRQTLAGGWKGELLNCRKNGTEFPISLSTSQIKNSEGKIIGLIGVARDITARKQTEEDLRRLSRRIIEAQETERLRVARELHDGVNQLLASAKMRIRKVEDSIAAFNPAASEILSRCGQLLVQALEENRRIAHNLHPSDLDNLGLAASCRNFCKEFGTRTNLKVQCWIASLGQRLPSAVELNLFRIVQEALNNIEKHAQSRIVKLRITVQADSIVLKIHDDGRGFDPQKTKAGKRAGHGLGLANMHERALSMGGSCEVRSTPKKGTSICVRVPCSNAK